MKIFRIKKHRNKQKKELITPSLDARVFIKLRLPFFQEFQKEREEGETNQDFRQKLRKWWNACVYDGENWFVFDSESMFPYSLELLFIGDEWAALTVV